MKDLNSQENYLFMETKENTLQPKTNRKHKDSMFRMLMNNKKELLELYNGINDTHYTNEEDVEINTLENAVYMNIKNDISFLFSFFLNLYEHQSTMNRNIPFRLLMYVADLMQKIYYGPQVYQNTLMKIKAPQFVVFYNGKDEMPDRVGYRLSDLYEYQQGEPELELKVTVLNINIGHNKELLAKCRTLREYAEFVDTVRKYREKYDDTDKAVQLAVEDCIQQDILKEFLEKNKAEVIKVSIYEYDEEAVMQALQQEARELGRKEGLERGMERGMERGEETKLISMVCKMLKRGNTVNEISDMLEEDIVRIKLIADAALHVTPQYDEDAIYEELVKENV